MTPAELAALETQALLEGTSEDELLTKAFKAGEKGAYQAIYDRHSARVHRVCRRMLGNSEDAQEAAQETFLRMYQALSRFNGRYQMGAWITRIATNVCLDYLRSRTRKATEPVDLDLIDNCEPVNFDTPESPEAHCIRNAESRSVRKTLAKLPPHHRAAIILRDFEGLSYEEVAVALDMTPQQVKALIHRARQSFKRSWTSGRLAALIPAFLHRRFDPIVKEQVPRTTSTTHLAEVAASSAPMVQSCSAVLQNCGAFVAERVAPLMTAAILGGAAVASTGVVTHEREQPKDSVPTRVEDRVASVVLKKGSGTKNVGASRDADARPAGSDVPPEPAPAASPTSAPAPSNGDAPAPAPAESAPPAPAQPTPSASPTPAPQVPAGWAMDFGSDVQTDAPTCACAGPATLDRETVSFTGDHVSSFDQWFTGTARASGRDVWGLELEQHASGSQHRMVFMLRSPEGTYRYEASGAPVQRRTTEWGGTVTTYTGTFSLGSRPTFRESVPERGTYQVDVAASAAEGRTVSVSFFLKEGVSS